ncbi:hypothetical protein OCK74_03380 [Chitinophagaceae bacterium LB-8]|uniref:Uncharacterized protein n=1 Tax=Paraflavisolibacter caeni TaxID=2982496 RepID=A0A9X3B759_9BACT|nr:hypothetical protein [Paraflavisolibacter caeni]MCU7548136.1 hypothetical protein [Paraflavisolibacter caeni]
MGNTQTQTTSRLAKKKSMAKWLKKILLKGNERVTYRIEETKIEKTSLDEAKFYLEQAEKQLQDSVDTGQIITERATNMLNLTSALLIALVAYSIDRWETNKYWDLMLEMAIWGSVVLAIISGLLIAAILPKDYCIPGWTPCKIFESRSFNEGADENLRQKNVILNLIMSYENDIKENRTLNRKRWTLLNFSMLIIVIAPLFFAAHYLLFR